MANYEPRDPGVPSDVNALQRYLVEELRTIAAAMAEIEGVLLNELNVEPARPRDGQIILADGTNFNPGSGAGFYGRSKGAWVFFGNTGTGTGGSGETGATGDTGATGATGAAGSGGISAIISKTASYTPILSEANAYFRMNSSSANTFTIPPNADVAYPVLTELHVRMIGTGQTTIAEGTAVSINNSPDLTLQVLGQGYTVSLLQTTIDNWDISGALVLA